MNDLELAESLQSMIEGAAAPVSASEARRRAQERSAHDRSAWISAARPRPITVASAVTVAAAAVLVVAFVTLGQGGTGSEGPGAPRASVVSPLTMRLVDSSSSPFASVGAGPQTGDLDCITALVCYASDTSGSAPTGSGVERTVDGGSTWLQTAALPDGAVLAWPLSCPTTTMCMGLARPAGSSPAAPAPLQVAVTTDGGDQWRIDSVPAPSGLSDATIDQIACSSAQVCVAHVFDGEGGTPGAAGTFLSTNDGGTTWSAASTVPPAASDSLWTLRCDPDGACIGLTPVGSVQSPATEGLVTLRSTDGGRTWAATSAHLAVGAGILLMSCGDALHCLAAYPARGGGTVALATTADGGATWRVTAPPASWPDIAVSVSCATGLDCFVSAANSTRSGYDDPVIEATHDGGVSWTPLALPTVGGSQLALVYPLDCPVAAGCIGVGATPAEFEPPRSLPTARSVPANGERVIISNLSKAD